MGVEKRKGVSIALNGDPESARGRAYSMHVQIHERDRGGWVLGGTETGVE